MGSHQQNILMEAAASEDLLEQKVHELDARLRQMKEERDQVVADNDDLQEQLDMTNTMRDVGMQKIGELKSEVQKLAEEITRIDYSCTTQEHELKTLSDHMCDLNSLKETVKDHNDEIAIIKEDYTRMKSHLNVSAKLELQTQERMYESRLLHLENGEKVVCIFYTEILIMHNQNHDIEITKDNTDLY